MFISKFFLVKSIMIFISFLICSSAIVGTFKNLLFIYMKAFLHSFLLFFSFSPFISLEAIKTNIFIRGKDINVERSLNITLNHAICIAGFSFIFPNNFIISLLNIQVKILKIVVPKSLKSK